MHSSHWHCDVFRQTARVNELRSCRSRLLRCPGAKWLAGEPWLPRRRNAPPRLLDTAPAAPDRCRIPRLCSAPPHLDNHRLPSPAMATPLVHSVRTHHRHHDARRAWHLRPRDTANACDSLPPGSQDDRIRASQARGNLLGVIPRDEVRGLTPTGAAGMRLKRKRGAECSDSAAFLRAAPRAADLPLPVTERRPHYQPRWAAPHRAAIMTASVSQWASAE